MKVVLCAFTLIVLVSGILADVSPSTPSNFIPRKIYSHRSVGAYSRRSRDAIPIDGQSQRPIVEGQGGRDNIGGLSSRKERDVSFVNIIDDSELKGASSGFHGVGARARRFGRDVGSTSVGQTPLRQENEQKDSVIGLILSRKEREVIIANEHYMVRMKRDNSKRAALKKLSTKFHTKKDQPKNKLNTDTTARSLGPSRSRRA